MTPFATNDDHTAIAGRAHARRIDKTGVVGRLQGIVIVGFSESASGDRTAVCGCNGITGLPGIQSEARADIPRLSQGISKNEGQGWRYVIF
jgi:hypothetical protein